MLTVNMGHEEDYNSTNGNKTARGLTSASLTGAPLTPLTWRLQGVRGGEDPQDTVRGPLSTGGLYGERAGWSLPGYPDGDWSRVSLPTTDTRPGISWYRTDVRLDLPHGQDTSLGLTFTDDPSRKYRATIFVNGWQVGNYVNYLGPQHTFPVPDGILDPHGHNSIALAVWNLDGTTGGLGKVSLTDYGSYTSPLRVGRNDSPGYDPRSYAMPKRPGADVILDVPNTARSGRAFTAGATVRVPQDRSSAAHLTASLSLPDGWSATPTGPTSLERLNPGRSARFTWTVRPPAGQLPSASALTATVRYVQDGRQATGGDERIVSGIPPAPPAGKSALSDLPFLSSTNGWGPVERDSSVGEQAAGDGRPLSIAGVGHPKGLGTNSVSDVQLYLAGQCSRLTAEVGVDDETGGAGTVTFSVIADGKTLVTTPTIRGKQQAVPIDVDVSGAQVVDLRVGDAGDGNGNDHGDWGTPTLTCA
ncbi:NPCBM/NEW2 domain-containing protein [Streptomyces mexicanus]